MSHAVLSLRYVQYWELHVHCSHLVWGAVFEKKKQSVFSVLYRNLDIKFESQLTTLCAVQYTVFHRNRSVILEAKSGLTLAVMYWFHAVRLKEHLNLRQL